MSMPTETELIRAGKTLVEWGGYIVLYGIITIIIGIAIIAIAININSTRKLINKAFIYLEQVGA